MISTKTLNQMKRLMSWSKMSNECYTFPQDIRCWNRRKHTHV